MVRAAKQEIITDVVVVGYGGAGAAAAITAHDNGAEVVVLEKMPEGGGNTRVSAGSILNMAGMEAVPHIEALCFGAVDRGVIEAYVENAMKNKDWIQELGGEVEYSTWVGVSYPHIPLPDKAWWPDVVAAEYINRFRVKGEGKWLGERLWRLLSANVKKRSITVMTETPAKELATSDKGEVVGVIAERDGKRISIKAKRAVILTCGGFEANEDMKRTFLPCEPFLIFGNPGNTGDGIRMAQKVGAALRHMVVLEGYLGFKAPGYEAAFPICIPDARFIYVDRSGERFCNEAGLDMHDSWRVVSSFDSKCLCYPHIPAYAVFDETLRRKGPLDRGSFGYNRGYEWSSDNSREVARGWIKRGQTIRELAGQLPIDASILENTVNKYNESYKLGRDPEFGRTKETLLAIEMAPFYAIELWPSLLNTQGGPRRDKEARVLDYDGKPIPRLYSAGEMGSLWGILYEGGGNVAECLVFGRIAGRNAAAEKPW